MSRDEALYLTDFFQDDLPGILHLVDPKCSSSNGAQRLTTVFLDLLDKQFPINSLKNKIKCRFPVDFAGALSVHVNHLNRSLKEITGKTTTQLIADRIMTEARLLLNNTDWNICEIGWCLGFEEGSHFINFFKKNHHTAPKAYRKTGKQNKQDLLKLI